MSKLLSPCSLIQVGLSVLPLAEQVDQNNKTLPVRLMVGLRFLVPTIGVRVPDRQLEKTLPSGSVFISSCR